MESIAESRRKLFDAEFGKVGFHGKKGMQKGKHIVSGSLF